MKSILRWLTGHIFRVKTSRISVAEMHALYVLQAYIERAFESPTYFTQVDIRITPIQNEEGGGEGSGVYFRATIKAFFFLRYIKGLYNMTRRDPVPPLAEAEILFRADNSRLPFWDTKTIDVTFLHISEAGIEPGMLGVNLRTATTALDRLIAISRLCGEAAKSKYHGKVVWKNGTKSS